MGIESHTTIDKNELILGIVQHNDHVADLIVMPWCMRLLPIRSSPLTLTMAFCLVPGR